MILIVNPPNPPGHVSNKDMMGGYGQTYGDTSPVRIPPVDAAYAAAVLKKEGVPYRVWDGLGAGRDLEDLKRVVAGLKPDYVAVRTSTPTVLWDLEVAKALKPVTSGKIIFFGPHVTSFPDSVLSSADVWAVLQGEPEYGLRDLGRSGPAGCAGLVWKDGAALARGPQRPQIDDLDALPFPAWEDFAHESYGIGDLIKGLRPFLPVQASRGCPFHCWYCPYPVSQGHKWRHRSPANVVAELRHMKARFGLRGVLFRDPEFSLQKPWGLEFARLLAEADLGIGWRAETRADFLDPELITAFAKAGCVGINLGVESSNLEVLTRIGRRPYPLDKLASVVRACREHDVETVCFFVMGLPGDDPASMLRTIRLAKEMDPDYAQFTVATPYPGTRLETWARENKMIDAESWDMFSGYEASMHNETASVEDITLLASHANLELAGRLPRVLARVRRNPKVLPSELRLLARRARARRDVRRRFGSVSRSRPS